MREIYVRLLDEGTTVYRPVKALKVNESTFTIMEDGKVDVEDEIWEFTVGTTVVVREVEIDGQVRLLASHLPA